MYIHAFRTVEIQLKLAVHSSMHNELCFYRRNPKGRTNAAPVLRAYIKFLLATTQWQVFTFLAKVNEILPYCCSHYSWPCQILTLTKRITNRPPFTAQCPNVYYLIRVRDLGAFQAVDCRSYP